MLRILSALVLVSAASLAHGAQLAACPVSLTNPDGQALALDKYDLRVAVHGPLTLVEMEMVFHNPQSKQIEGRFLYQLPTGAVISRFAKEVDGKLMEGEVVERLRAQSVYTQILQSMRDPALLEMDQGNRFSARVFPIPPNGTTRLLLSYSQVVPLVNGERKIVLPLAGMPKIGDFNFSANIKSIGETYGSPTFDLANGPHPADASGDQKFTRQGKDFTPGEDYVLVFKHTDDKKMYAAMAGQYQMLCYTPDIKKAEGSAARPGTILYFDSSASNVDMEVRRLKAIELLIDGAEFFRKGEEPNAFAFDVEVERLKVNAPLGIADSNYLQPAQSLVHALNARHALGATNLEAALKHIGEQARATKDPQRFVLVSDGIATLGAREVRDCVAALGEWPEQHVLHALVIGSKQDEKMLNAIVAKTRGRVVTLTLGNEMEKDIPRVVSELTTPLGQSFEFYDESAAWIYPKTFRDVRPGSEMIVFIDKKKAPSVKPGVIWRGPDGKVIKDQPLDVAATEVSEFAPLLQREASAALLNHLEKREQDESDEKKRAELRKQRLEVSVKNRVLCPLTSLLVLESENDYERFGIERTALADVMVIGQNGIELKKRKSDEIPRAVVQNKRRGKWSDATKADAKPEPDSKVEPKPQEDTQDALKSIGGREVADEELAKDGKEQLEALSMEGAEDKQLADEKDAPMNPANAHPFAQAAEPAATAGQRAPASANAFAMRPAERRVEDAAADRTATAAPTTPAPAAVPPPASAAETLAANVSPEWVKQLGAIPTEAELNALHQQVAGSPRDRTLRNAYANALCKAQKWDSLQGQAFEWLPFDPENPQVYEYLGKSATGLNDPKLALRAITSIAEVAPNRAALLARAGWLLITAKKYETAQQMFREAMKNRQDDCNIYRGLALSYWLDGKFDKAGEVYEDALKKDFDARYGDTKRVLIEEFGYLLRAELASDPKSDTVVTGIARSHGVDLKHTDAFRATLCWETDANDVDLHVVDPSGEECWYSHMKNASGLELYSDQTQGLGPEVIRCDKALKGTYHVGVNYFSSGPMGVSRGAVVVFQTINGKTEAPVIVPFCLIPEGSDMRHVAAVKY